MPFVPPTKVTLVTAGPSKNRFDGIYKSAWGSHYPRHPTQQIATNPTLHKLPNVAFVTPIGSLWMKTTMTTKKKKNHNNWDNFRMHYVAMQLVLDVTMRAAYWNGYNHSHQLALVLIEYLELAHIVSKPFRFLPVANK
jgi:hypothetical protein